MYVEDDMWQQTVIGLMKEAQLVVLQVGATKGLVWEIETAVQDNQPEKLLISLPFHLSAAKRSILCDEFERRTKGLFPISLPKRLDDGAFIAFGPKWRPRLLKTSLWHPWIKKPNIEQCLKPLLEKRLKKATTKSSK